MEKLKDILKFNIMDLLNLEVEICNRIEETKK